MKSLYIILMLMVGSVEAATYIDISGISKHSKESYSYVTREFNEINTGAGLTVDISDNSSVSIGRYKNSFWRKTNYIIYNRDFYSTDNLRFGGSVGLASGYDINHNIFVMIPTLSIGDKYRLKFGFIPKRGPETSTAIFVNASIRISE